MKFMYFFLPTLPATMDERQALRPLAMQPERWQRMIEEVVEMAQLAEEVGFDAVCFPEHHLHSEGIEMGSLPVLTQHVIHNTKRMKVGPIGYVLPGWNPLRLALEIAWLDQLTKGRTFVGFARGYQNRWLSQMAQKIHVMATASEETIRWCARENIIPTVLLPQPPVVRKFAEAYQEEAAKAGRKLSLGESFGVLHCIYLANNKEQGYKLGDEGICGIGFKQFFHH